MVNYYAIQVKIGTESTAASKLLNLKKKAGSYCEIEDVIVPFKNSKRLDLDNQVVYDKAELLYQGYIFIVAKELSHKVYEILRRIGNIIIKVLPVPLSESEVSALNIEMSTENLELTVTTAKAKVSIEKVVDFLCRKKSSNFSLQKKEKRSFLKLKQEYFREIVCGLELTIRQLLETPSILFERLIIYETTNQRSIQ